ncbi:MAG TPA: hypothetical protein DEF51_53900 [Myxococcales bacterium]|nr:hypothetical protein [Myxococcales bacterium]
MKVSFVFFTDPPRPFSSSVAQLAAVVRAAGHEASALEVGREERIVDAARRLEAEAADVVAISSMTRDWPGAAGLLRELESDAFVVVGGYHATMAPRDVAVSPRVDAICIGEGERPLAALLDRLATGTLDASLPGLWLRADAGFADAPPAADPEPVIDALPRWDYEIFGDVRELLGRGINTFGPHVDGYLPVRASRGCPFTCAYCSAPRWGKVLGLSDARMKNVRDVSALCEELADLRDRYAPEGFEFWDEHFPIPLAWLEAFARAYPRRVGLPFKVEMHPNAATRPRLELLAEAGCVLFHCGVEAGDEALRRDVLDRRSSDARLDQLFADCRELGLPTSASLMTMLPTETRAQAHSTVSLLRKLRPGSIIWSTYQPLPGTVLGEAAVEAWPGPARETFDDYDDLVSRTPADMTELERGETFHELATLQNELVTAAGQAPPRPLDRPTGKRAPSEGLLALLDLGAVRVRSARLDPSGLILELAADSFEPREIVLAPLEEGARHYRRAQHLGLSYRGKDAPRALLDCLDAMALRLASATFTELCAAL